MPIYKCNYRTFRFGRPEQRDAEGRVVAEREERTVSFHPCEDANLGALYEADVKRSFAATFGDGWILEETFDQVHHVRVVVSKV